MSILQIFLIFLAPPLAVIDKGCGAIFLVSVLLLFGWWTSVMGALLICLFAPNMENKYKTNKHNNYE